VVGAELGHQPVLGAHPARGPARACSPAPAPARVPGCAAAAPRRTALIGTALVFPALAGPALAGPALVGPLLVDRELDASKSAAAAGKVENAEDHADTARSIEPWAASPYVQLGLLAQAKGEYPTAIEKLGQAIDREDQNWVLYYLRSKAEHEAGNMGAAEADLQRAQQLNPLEKCLSEGWEGCG